MEGKGIVRRNWRSNWRSLKEFEEKQENEGTGGRGGV